MSAEDKVSQHVKAIQTTCTEEEYAQIKTAADKTKRSMAAFVLYYSLEASKKINE